MAFVSTNSINQGEQASILWNDIIKTGVEIDFAHQSFKWENNAKRNAGVICAIIGLRNSSSKEKLIFNSIGRYIAKNINAYLTNGNNVVILKRSSPLSKLPIMLRGSGASDGGHLLFDENEKIVLDSESKDSHFFIKKAIGSIEFINGKKRYCLWINDINLAKAISISWIEKRVSAVKKFRLCSKKPSTVKDAMTSHRFSEPRYFEKNSIIIPRHSSENRDYIPIGFIESDTVIIDSAFSVYDPPTWIFAVISSRMHMTWVRAVAGRLKTDYRYSSSLCYNTFPFPDISAKQKEKLEDHVFRVLDEREKHPEKTMAQLYDPDKMPEALRQAHHDMDIAIEQCYRAKPFTNDEERLEYLFTLYEAMIAAEKKRG
jgi:hypothetical protein